MRLRLLAPALLLALLATGCAAQRGSTATTEDSTGSEMPPPNLPVVVYGVWDFTMTAMGDTLTGVFTLRPQGEGPSHVTASNGLDAPVELETVDVQMQAFRITGTVQAEQAPYPFTLAGTLDRDTMDGENDMAGMVYRFRATRAGE